jgi:Fe-S oxidoreductase
VLSKERCTGIPPSAPATSTCSGAGRAEHRDLKAAGVKKIVASCPHCVKTIGHDYRMMGYEVEIVHSASSWSS